jgi:GTPase SAR1 family protein
MLILFFLVFEEKSQAIVSALLIKPIFGSLKESSFLIDGICIFLFIGILCYVVFKARKQIRISPILVVSLITLALLYSISTSYNAEPYNFVNFKIPFLRDFHLLDIIYGGPISIIFFYLTYIYIYRRVTSKYSNNTNSQVGFYTDSPVTLNSENDVFSHLGYINDIRNRILKTKNSGNSFAIGIIAPWGAGKTTFLESLELSLQKSNVIQIRFNPWLARNKEAITSMFFSDLAINLAKYDESLKKQILEYGKGLLQNLDTEFGRFAKATFSILGESNDLRSRYQILNEAILALNKKIIVYIDDVDRLDSEEVVEVLRLIRNSANFGNIFFVVAFDKIYVTRSINKDLLKHSEKYLEKIFQVEFYLPLNPNKTLFKSLFFKEVRKLVDQESNSILDQIENPEIKGFSVEILPPVTQ